MGALASVRIVAHRGASTVRPENTLAAFRTAIDLGADAIEFDVHSTSDGALVVHHDYLLDRTTTGTGPVHERDLRYVRGLDAGAWFDRRYRSERVPVLGEVLSFAGIDFELELKGFTWNHMQTALDTVRAYDAIERTEFTSWHVPMLLALKDACPEARVGVFSPPP
jgi:glycerophosphoryl diester phosphodiesterase